MQRALYKMRFLAVKILGGRVAGKALFKIKKSNYLIRMAYFSGYELAVEIKEIKTVSFLFVLGFGSQYWI